MNRSISATFGFLLVCLAGGCTSSKSLPIGLYARGHEPVIRHAPETAVYKVQWLSADQKEIRTSVGSDRVLAKGEPLGFAAGPNGRVTAIAGVEQFPLEHLPSHARFCRWDYTLERETHLGKGMKVAELVMVDSASIVGAAALLGGLIYLDGKLEDCNFGGSGGADHRSAGPSGDHNAPHAPTSRKSE